ncbi:hypothetical protein R1sor_008281 [Riccia sorocarpa]|uniref:Reverse transcriptase zinc-binding domain-containing protein n=1 Tax=Riccia sorocarpa TaxID=122646 RepID=A0ABD3HWJ0_9MARC
MAASSKLALKMANVTGAFQQGEIQLLAAAMKAARIRYINAFQPQTTIKNMLLTAGVTLNPETIAVLEKWDSIFPREQAHDTAWSETGGWAWGSNLPKGNKCWKQTTKEWRNLLYSNKDDTGKLNSKWELQQTTVQWKQMWKCLWSGPAQIRTKIRTWRFLRGGYFTNAKAKSWGLGDGTCARCTTEQETYLHAIWACPAITQRAKWAFWLLTNQSTTDYSTGEQLMQLFDRALHQHRNNPAPLILMLAILRVNWAERNEAQFKQKKTFRGVQPILRETSTEIEVAGSTKGMSQHRKDVFGSDFFVVPRLPRLLSPHLLRSWLSWSSRIISSVDHGALESISCEFLASEPTLPGENLPLDEDKRTRLSEMLHIITRGWVGPSEEDHETGRGSRQIRTFDKVESLILAMLDT